MKPKKRVASRPRTSRPRKTVNAERWRSLFEQAEDAQVVCDRDGLILEANQKAVQLLGLTAGKPASVLDHVTPSVADKFAEALKRRQGRQQSLVGVSLLNEGRLSLLADIQVSALGDEVSLVAFKDASRRWRLESHMQRLMTAVDATPDVVFLTDAEFRIAFVNAAFQTATGYTIEEALGRTADFLRSPDCVRAMGQYMDSVSQGTGWKGELTNRRSDGTEYPVEATISPIYDSQGKRIGYAAFERDLSLRKRLEHELRVERNHALSIINSLDAAVYTLDQQFRLCHINEGWRKMPAHHGWLDMTQPPEAGRSLLDYVPDKNKQAELRALFELVLEQGRPQEIQATADSHCWAVKIVPWHYEGQATGLIYVVTDQTKFHELERQLYQAQKMETIGALAAGVAHDFNNLLQAIRGNVSLILLHEQLPEALLHQVQQIDQAATRASEITQQLLSFSRASEEKVSVLDFNQVIQEASQLVKRSLLSKIRLELKLADKPLRVRMDATRAQQLLLNLCVNAQDAMPHGGKLTLSNAIVRLNPLQAAKARSTAGAEFVVCRVADTGCGIPPEIVSRIFDPFFTTKEKGKGTGLGLAIAQSVVTQANGFIEVESELGKGTTFSIYLPCVQGSSAPKPKSSPLKLAKGVGRVMVVDDLDLVLDFTRTFLMTIGLEVFVANNADDALRTVAALEKPVDLIFTDFNMPGMNGRELIQEASSRWPEMKFILASGYLEDQDRAHITKDPRVHILDKPFNMREAGELILRILTKS